MDRQRNDRLGRIDCPSHLNTGGRYNPATDSWTATSTTNAPAARTQSHGSVDWQRNDRLGWTTPWRHFEHRRKILRRCTEPDTYAHTFSDSNRNSYADSNCNANVNTDSNANGHTNSDRFSDGYCNT